MEWNGRVDGYDEDILRIHQVIQVKNLDELMENDYTGKKYVLLAIILMKE